MLEAHPFHNTGQHVKINGYMDRQIDRSVNNCILREKKKKKKKKNGLNDKYKLSKFCSGSFVEYSLIRRLL